MGADGVQGGRTLLVGIDAACEQVLSRVFESGRAQTLRALFEEGVSGPLESQLPPWTPSAWPSLYTGVNPGKHGVFGFLTFDGYEWDVVDRTDVREAAIWELLDHHDMTSVVVNVPVTGPPRPFDGALVPGYVAPEDPTCHPEGLLDDVRDAIGEYRVYPREFEDRDRDVQAYRECVRMRGDAFRYLTERFDPDFGFVQFQQTDTVFHERPGDWGAVEAIYDAVDDAVTDAIRAFEPDNVVVASDHGIGPYGGHEFRVNEFLRDEGYVRTTRDSDGMPSWASIARDRLRDDTDSGWTADAARRMVRVASTLGLTSQRIHAVLDRMGLADVVVEHVPSDVIRAGTETVDFADSTAFVRDRIELGVRINLEGREPDGVVSPDEYDEVRSELVDRLSAVETPDGRPVFDAVLPREDVFEGPYVDEAPDVVTVPNEFDEFLSASLRGATFAAPSEPYNHKLTGSVALFGDGVTDGVGVDGAHLYDVAPTLCSLLGIPVSERMDGQTLTPVTTTHRHEYPSIEHNVPERPSTEAVERRLEDLGYIEREP